MRSLKVAVIAAVAVACAALVWLIQDRQALAVDAGKAVEAQKRAVANYNRLCLPCHGTAGAGDGPAAPWLWPEPRDLTRAQYKWRSTEVGQVPLDEDLARVIRYGVSGTSMHGFGDALSAAEIDALVVLVKNFAAHKFAKPAPAVDLGERPEVDAKLIAAGKAGFIELGCDKCHGTEGKGDGPAAKGLVRADGAPETTYDLTVQAFRRPRSADDDGVELIARSLMTGLTGTPMPSFLDAGSREKLWAIAAWVDSISPALEPELNRSIGVNPIAASRDRTRSGYWPGSKGDPDAIVWGHTIELQREPPSNLAPAQASLSSRQCARCHNAQYRDWQSTVHGAAASPGLMAQLVEYENDPTQGGYVESCVRCHTPLAEQHAMLRPGQWGGDDSVFEYSKNPAFDQTVQAEGINCASCHVREWNRHGPPKNPGNGLLPIPNYPVARSDFYERSDFCLGCHQLEPSNLLGDKPLLNTYREWLAGPYFPRGVQCQHCHMPNREHTWKGVHDPETFRQGFSLDAIAKRTGEIVSVRVRMTNVGAGHYLPTTPTPAAFLDAELLDSVGRPIPGAKSTRRIGRNIDTNDAGEWVEVEDSRIPPGEFLELAAAWSDVADAKTVLVTVRVEPDEYYERLYRGELASDRITDRQRELYSEALARAEASHFVALTQRYSIE